MEKKRTKKPRKPKLKKVRIINVHKQLRVILYKGRNGEQKELRFYDSIDTVLTKNLEAALAVFLQKGKIILKEI